MGTWSHGPCRRTLSTMRRIHEIHEMGASHTQDLPSPSSLQDLQSCSVYKVLVSVCIWPQRVWEMQMFALTATLGRADIEELALCSWPLETSEWLNHVTLERASYSNITIWDLFLSLTSALKHKRPLPFNISTQLCGLRAGRWGTGIFSIQWTILLESRDTTLESLNQKKKARLHWPP